MELCDLPAYEIPKRLKKGEFRAVDVLDSVLQRIAAVDGRPGTLDAGELTAEAVKLSGLDNPKSVQQLTKWLNAEMAEEITDLRKDTVKGLLKGDIESDEARRVLEIRQELSKTSTKKYAAMDAAVCGDERVRGLLQFYGANRTGRWAGRLVQVQNLPRNYLETLSHARE